jgi:hypothetical protein
MNITFKPDIANSILNLELNLTAAEETDYLRKYRDKLYASTPIKVSVQQIFRDRKEQDIFADIVKLYLIDDINNAVLAYCLPPDGPIGWTSNCFSFSSVVRVKEWGTLIKIWTYMYNPIDTDELFKKIDLNDCHKNKTEWVKYKVKESLALGVVPVKQTRGHFGDWGARRTKMGDLILISVGAYTQKNIPVLLNDDSYKISMRFRLGCMKLLGCDISDHLIGKNAGDVVRIKQKLTNEVIAELINSGGYALAYCEPGQYF